MSDELFVLDPDDQVRGLNLPPAQHLCPSKTSPSDIIIPDRLPKFMYCIRTWLTGTDSCVHQISEPGGGVVSNADGRDFSEHRFVHRTFPSVFQNAHCRPSLMTQASPVPLFIAVMLSYVLSVIFPFS
jgi:hypothetical protein